LSVLVIADLLMTCRTRLASTALVVALLAVANARAQDPCAAFTWDVSRERALFASTATTVRAAATSASAPALEADTLYALQLSPQSDVTFALPPGSRKTPTGPVYAGFIRFRAGPAGTYRISADQPVYIDVIAAGSTIPSKDFQGRPGCSAPHKVVEFDLPADTELTLQASGAPSAVARLAVTRTPAFPRTQ
jgi:hypothetical protein